ncbi:hypothetical protein LTR04_005059 [Oleoguttula sp. CCFEE 6159]|nr:hypothetical protein LTR04_005059 [Oleoguttula sp. CCFEE 6159]
MGHCFTTSDLWAPHPDPQKPHLWRYAGRVDDLVVQMGEVELNAAPLERRLQSDPVVHAALVGWQGRSRSLLLLEIAGHKDADGGRGEAVREMVWPAVQAQRPPNGRRPYKVLNRSQSNLKTSKRLPTA